VKLYGLPGLLAGAFLSGTMLPVSSETLLIAGISFGLDPWQAVLWASMGNCAACLVNYGLGAFLFHRMHSRLTGTRVGRLALAWMKRYGTWTLAASWLPIVGDPITVVAGLARVRLVIFIVIVFSLRILRYAMLVETVFST
jgi:membrane protein YqaA with SNARE-associated domain